MTSQNSVTSWVLPVSQHITAQSSTIMDFQSVQYSPSESSLTLPCNVTTTRVLLGFNATDQYRVVHYHEAEGKLTIIKAQLRSDTEENRCGCLFVWSLLGYAVFRVICMHNKQFNFCLI
ncbi:hypothetical protein ILYODFUR_038326 [Ilyodon furcidens]|uniref:Uncharacterized protein n=1 Tax=Ilyodon furcidens TaxID=33524 RepID=A0ABV0UYN0_9TELE